MRETKDQKIERLEKIIDNQQKELSKVRKDRKRLNYAVERLERVLKNHSSREDTKRIKELETTISTLNKKIEKLNNSISYMQNQLLYF